MLLHYALATSWRNGEVIKIHEDKNIKYGFINLYMSL
jgi:hypothetical protein